MGCRLLEAIWLTMLWPLHTDYRQEHYKLCDTSPLCYCLIASQLTMQYRQPFVRCHIYFRGQKNLVVQERVVTAATAVPERLPCLA